MNKYVFLYPPMQIDGPPTPEQMKAWEKWFDSISANVVDGGNPFGGGVEVTADGVTPLTADMSPVSGYTIVNAENMDAAVALLAGCPIPGGIRVHEALPM